MTPTQGHLPLRSVDASAGPSFAIWKRDVVRFARRHLETHDTISAVDIRSWAAGDDGYEPPHQNHWGVIVAHLKRLGLVQVGTLTSTTKSRNAARVPVWAAGPEWGAAREGAA